MYHKIASVTPKSGLILDVVFQNGEVRRFEAGTLLDRWPEFRALRDVPGLFSLAHVALGGYGIAWNDDLDLECEDVWESGVPAKS